MLCVASGMAASPVPRGRMVARTLARLRVAGRDRGSDGEAHTGAGAGGAWPAMSVRARELALLLASMTGQSYHVPQLLLRQLAELLAAGS